jgi:hypothetical protein
MHRGDRRLRVFALIWAVLQFALPASATLADARLAVAPPGRSHVEETPGRDCTPSHSPDCAVCKHLSTTSLGSTHLATAFVDDGRETAAPGRIAQAARVAAGVPLARAPPAGA